MDHDRAIHLREFASRYTAAWCSQDAARVAGFYSLDGLLRVNADATAVGRDAIAAVAQGFMAAFADLKVIMDDIAVDGDQTVYRWTLVGTNTGPGGDRQDDLYAASLDAIAIGGSDYSEGLRGRESRVCAF